MNKKPFIKVDRGIGGYFATMYWWNPDMDGFWEPWTTGLGRYATKEEARKEAKAWAELEELEYIE